MKPIRARALKRIQRWSLSLYSAHALKGKTHREVTNLHLDHHLLVDSLHQMFMCACFLRRGRGKKRKKKICLLTWMCMLDFVHVCVYVWACTLVFRGQEWRCYPMVIHHKRDTLSPALRYAEAMFYKRITRQRAPTGHPLPPRATCKDVR